MSPLLEAVPNFSEGRDPATVRALVDAIRGVSGVEVLDWSSDPDHHRSVVTVLGTQAGVEEASLAAARVALERIDLRSHEGVHPRVGALDVLPFVPLEGATMDDAVASARRVALGLAEMGVPVFHYGQASDPPGRGLAELRRGGFEALRDGFPADRRPDVPRGAGQPHATAGVTCVGAREVLLAWNVFVEGVGLEVVRRIARDLREVGGGFAGLRALGLHLEEQGRLQVSMNLEDPRRIDPLDVVRAIEEAVGAEGGRVTETEVIGMIPEALVLPAAEDRLHLSGLSPSRLLSHRVSRHLVERAAEDSVALRSALAAAGSDVPVGVRDAASRLLGTLLGTTTPDADR